MEIRDIQKSTLPKPPIGKGLLVLGIFLAVVFGIWYFTSDLMGGDKKPTATTKSIPKIKAKAPETFEASYYNNWIKFVPSPSAKETYPEKEYLEIQVVQKNLSGADASKWMLENSDGDKVALGNASTLPLSGKVNATEALNIKAGDHLFVSTGRSPIGVSFRVNKCSGYMEQFQDFVPPISGECPYTSSEKNFYSLDNKCQMFAQSIRNCEANTRPLPSGVKAGCKAFLDVNANYNGCVAIHKNDPDFYLKEWRIFLGKEKELWAQPKDTILLLDEKEKLIDVLKY